MTEKKHEMMSMYNNIAMEREELMKIRSKASDNGLVIEWLDDAIYDLYKTLQLLKAKIDA